MGGVEERRIRDRDELLRFLEEQGVTDAVDVAGSFQADAEISVIHQERPVTLLRVFGGDSQPIGRYYFCCLNDGTGPLSRWTDAGGLALPPNNLLTDLALVQIPAGTTQLAGIVADNFPSISGTPKIGGNVQVFLPKVNSFPFERYRLLPDSRQASRIRVLFDEGRVLTFQ